MNEYDYINDLIQLINKYPGGVNPKCDMITNSARKIISDLQETLSEYEEVENLLQVLKDYRNETKEIFSKDPSDLDIRIYAASLGIDYYTNWYGLREELRSIKLGEPPEGYNLWSDYFRG